MSPQDLHRRVRELESQDHFAAAAELRWVAASRAVSGSACPCDPAADRDPDSESDPSCHLEAALRDAEALGDERAVARLVGALAALERPSRRAA
jgi:hypothetical protein